MYKKKQDLNKPISFRKRVLTLTLAFLFFALCAVIALLNIIEANDFWVVLGSSGRRNMPAGILFIGAVFMSVAAIVALIKITVDRKRNPKPIIAE